MSEENPYAAPSASPKSDVLDEDYRIRLEARDHQKAEAIIKDAGQFWLAIIICIACSILGAIIIPIWYTVRLIQWNGLAKKYPALLASDVPAKSMQARFKSSQWKLITGVVAGLIIMFCFVASYIVFLFLTPTLIPI